MDIRAIPGGLGGHFGWFLAVSVNPIPTWGIFGCKFEKPKNQFFQNLALEMGWMACPGHYSNNLLIFGHLGQMFIIKKGPFLVRFWFIKGSPSKWVRRSEFQIFGQIP